MTTILPTQDKSNNIPPSILASHETPPDENVVKFKKSVKTILDVVDKQNTHHSFNFKKKINNILNTQDINLNNQSEEVRTAIIEYLKEKNNKIKILMTSHGETATDLQEKEKRNNSGSQQIYISGDEDEPLNEEGEEQSMLKGEKFKFTHIDKFYSGEYVRNVQTSEIIKNKSGIKAPIDYSPFLNNPNKTDLGRYRESDMARFLYGDAKEQLEFLMKILIGSDDETVLIVTHQSVMENMNILIGSLFQKTPLTMSKIKKDSSFRETVFEYNIHGINIIDNNTLLFKEDNYLSNMEKLSKEMGDIKPEYSWSKNDDGQYDLNKLEQEFEKYVLELETGKGDHLISKLLISQSTDFNFFAVKMAILRKSDTLTPRVLESLSEKLDHDNIQTLAELILTKEALSGSDEYKLRIARYMLKITHSTIKHDHHLKYNRILNSIDDISDEYSHFETLNTNKEIQEDAIINDFRTRSYLEVFIKFGMLTREEEIESINDRIENIQVSKGDGNDGSKYDIDSLVEQGKNISLSGEGGSGKSTLLRQYTLNYNRDPKNANKIGLYYNLSQVFDKIHEYTHGNYQKYKDGHLKQAEEGEDFEQLKKKNIDNVFYYHHMRFFGSLKCMFEETDGGVIAIDGFDEIQNKHRGMFMNKNEGFINIIKELNDKYGVSIIRGGRDLPPGTIPEDNCFSEFDEYKTDVYFDEPAVNSFIIKHIFNPDKQNQLIEAYQKNKNILEILKKPIFITLACYVLNLDNTNTVELIEVLGKGNEFDILEAIINNIIHYYANTIEGNKADLTKIKSSIYNYLYLCAEKNDNGIHDKLFEKESEYLRSKKFNPDRLPIISYNGVDKKRPRIVQQVIKDFLQARWLINDGLKNEKRKEGGLDSIILPPIDQYSSALGCYRYLTSYKLFSEKYVEYCKELIKKATPHGKQHLENEIQFAFNNPNTGAKKLLLDSTCGKAFYLQYFLLQNLNNYSCINSLGLTSEFHYELENNCVFSSKGLAGNSGKIPWTLLDTLKRTNIIPKGRFSKKIIDLGHFPNLTEFQTTGLGLDGIAPHSGIRLLYTSDDSHAISKKFKINPQNFENLENYDGMYKYFEFKKAPRGNKIKSVRLVFCHKDEAGKIDMSKCDSLEDITLYKCYNLIGIKVSNKATIGTLSIDGSLSKKCNGILDLSHINGLKRVEIFSLSITNECEESKIIAPEAEYISIDGRNCGKTIDLSASRNLKNFEVEFPPELDKIILHSSLHETIGKELEKEFQIEYQ